MPLEDFETSALLAPVAGDAPAGSDAAESRLGGDKKTPGLAWMTLESDFNAALDNERALEKKDPRATFDRKLWQVVANGSHFVLQDVSKDLRAGVYLTNALARLWGFAGFRRGLDVLAGLLETYWEVEAPPTLYPRGHEDDYPLESLFTALVKLDGNGIPDTLRREPLTKNADGVGLSRLDYLVATDLKDAAREAAVARFKNSLLDAKVTSDEFVRELYAEVLGSLAGLDRLQVLLEKRGAYKSPVPRAVQDALRLPDTERELNEVRKLLFELAGPRLVAPEPAPPSNLPPASGSQPAPLPGPERLDTVLRSRDDAFAFLERVAVFFEKTEPQSTIPAQLRKVIRHGRLTPEEFLRAVVDDDSVLRRLLDRLGYQDPAG